MKETTYKIRLITIFILLVTVLGLTIFGVTYALKNRNSDEIASLKDENTKVTISKGQLDNIKLPVNDSPLVYDELPKTNNTIEEIDYKTFKKIFKTKGKSIIILVRTNCAYCKEFLPIAEKTLNSLNLNAYKIDIDKLTIKEYDDITNYISFNGTPTTYIVVNGNAKHSLSGVVDEETFKAYIDYFYIRNY